MIFSKPVVLLRNHPNYLPIQFNMKRIIVLLFSLVLSAIADIICLVAKSFASRSYSSACRVKKDSESPPKEMKLKP